MILAIVTIASFAFTIIYSIFRWKKLDNKILIKFLLSFPVLALSFAGIYFASKEVKVEEERLRIIYEKQTSEFFDNIIQLNPVDFNYDEAIEFPKDISRHKQNIDIIVPFKLKVGLEQIKTIIRVNDRNIVKSILQYSPTSYEENKFDVITRDEPGTEPELVLYQGDIFFNIPFRRIDVRSDNKIKVKIDLLRLRNIERTFDFFFNINLDPWTYFADFSKHELQVGEQVSLKLTTKNNGRKENFYVTSKLLDSSGRQIIAEPIPHKQDFVLDYGETNELKLDLPAFDNAGNYIIELAVIKRIGYLQEENNKNWRDNFSSKKYYFNVLGAIAIVEGELREYLEATISDDTSIRRGSVARFLLVINIYSHKDVLNFYLSCLEQLIESGKQDAVYNATTIITKLDPQLLRKNENNIRNIYTLIEGSQDWGQTSRLYNYIKQSFLSQ